jgi:hypothetical protein
MRRNEWQRTATEEKEISLMALTRKFLSALGIEAEKIDEIITAHSETVDALKEQRDEYKESADKLVDVQKELNELKKTAEQAEKDPYKVKYEAVKEEFENYKSEQSAKETKHAKTEAYRSLLKECGIADKRIEAVLRVSDIDSVKLDKDGTIKDADTLKKSISEEWSDFIQTARQKGADTANPPKNDGGGTKTRADIMNIKDTTERQRAIAENLDLFNK